MDKLGDYASSESEGEVETQKQIAPKKVARKAAKKP